MHGIGAHSAVAIKRQRRRREQARKNWRGRKPRTSQDESREMSNKVMGTITMFHVGAVFLTVGLFLMLASVITNETKQSEIAELIGTGIVCLVIGIFLIILNSFYGRKEEEELQNYVETRLGRSRSGQRLYHETDSVQEGLDEAAKSPSIDSEMGHNSGKHKGGKNVRGPNTTTVNIVNETTAGSNHNQNSHPRHHSSSAEDII